MISINIPVYNIEVGSLVLQLIKQAKKLDIAFEIRVYDDCSKKEMKIANRIISDYPNVFYLELEKNLGRSAIRNKMGFESEFDYLLFIDADSKIVLDNYLETFIKNVQPNKVLCGGTEYNKTKPTNPEKLLRWFYGKSREAISAEIRNNEKGFIITSNNLFIEKNIFKKVHFREDIKNYGHEDTLLGYDLYRSSFEIFHLDNPVEHTGLEDSNVFIYKTKIALETLFQITNNLLQNEIKFVDQVHFLNRYSKIKKYIPVLFFRIFYKISHSIIEKNLKGKKPRLFWFDFYKLSYYSTLKQNHS